MITIITFTHSLTGTRVGLGFNFSGLSFRMQYAVGGEDVFHMTFAQAKNMYSEWASSTDMPMSWGKG